MSQGTGFELKPYVVGLRRRRARPRSPSMPRRRQRRRRRRRGLQRHAEPARRRHDQHRLRRDRGRSAPGQPDALPAVLPREARLLPRRRHVLRLPDRTAFFSRRIGLDRRASRSAIVGGGKLTGQAGSNDIGALYVRTGGGRRRRSGEDFLVGRMRRRVLQQSYLRRRSTPAGPPTTRRVVDARQTAGAGLPAGDGDVPRQQEPERVRATGSANSTRGRCRRQRGLGTPASSIRTTSGSQRRLPGSAARTTTRRSGFTPRPRVPALQPGAQLESRGPTTRHPVHPPVPVRRRSGASSPTSRTGSVTRTSTSSRSRVELHSGDNARNQHQPQLRAPRRGLRDRPGRDPAAAAPTTTSSATRCRAEHGQPARRGAAAARRVGHVLLRRSRRVLARASTCGRARACASTPTYEYNTVSLAEGRLRHAAAFASSPTRSSARSCTWSTTSSTTR